MRPKAEAANTPLTEKARPRAAASIEPDVTRRQRNSNTRRTLALFALSLLIAPLIAFAANLLSPAAHAQGARPRSGLPQASSAWSPYGGFPFEGEWHGVTVCYDHRYFVRLKIRGEPRDAAPAEIDLYHPAGAGIRGIPLQISRASNREIRLAQHPWRGLYFRRFLGNGRSDVITFDQVFINASLQLYELPSYSGAIIAFRPSGLCQHVYLARAFEIRNLPVSTDRYRNFGSYCDDHIWPWFRQARGAVQQARDLKARYPDLLKDYNPDGAFTAALANDDSFRTHIGIETSKLSAAQASSFLEHFQLCIRYGSFTFEFVSELASLWPKVAEWQSMQPFAYRGHQVETRYVLPLTAEALLASSREQRSAQARLTAFLQESITLEEALGNTAETEGMVRRFVREFQALSPPDFLRYLEAFSERASAHRIMRGLAERYGLTAVPKLPLTSDAAPSITPADTTLPRLSRPELDRLRGVIILDLPGSRAN